MTRGAALLRHLFLPARSPFDPFALAPAMPPLGSLHRFNRWWKRTEM